MIFDWPPVAASNNPVPAIDTHPCLGRVFAPGRLTLGPIVALATVTRSIALGSAGIVLPLREPKTPAKQVTSFYQFVQGRRLLGLSSGDRPSGYPLIDVDSATRVERLRDAFDVYRTIVEQDFPRFASLHFGRSNGGLDLIAKPPFGRTPSLAIGRGQQSPEWIACDMDGSIAPSPGVDPRPAFVAEWRWLVRVTSGEDAYKPIGIAGYPDPLPDRDAPLQRIRAGLWTGGGALAAFLDAARVTGGDHAALNPKVSRRAHAAVSADLATDVLPAFPMLDGDRATA